MNKIKLMFAVLISVFAMQARADVSVGADASSSSETSHSTNIKRDKSLSVDKSGGKRKTQSQANEATKETGSGTTESQKRSKSADSSNSQTTELNINAVLISQFIQRYESFTGQTANQAQYVFATCKPFTGLTTEYPLLNSCPVNQRDGSAYQDVNDIAPVRAARHLVGSCGNWGTNLKGGEDNSYQPFYDWNTNNPIVSKYARCRIIASAWLKWAGDEVVKNPVRNEQDLIVRINHAYDYLDQNSEKLMIWLSNYSKDLWAKADCAPTFTRWKEFSKTQKPDLRCGVLMIEGNQVVVNGKETMSAAAIEGQSYKIAISQSSSQSVASDTLTDTHSTTSQSERVSDSTEKFDEAKKSSGMTVSSGSEDGTSTETKSGSDSSMSASPK